jgi:hypothetical protein
MQVQAASGVSAMRTPFDSPARMRGWNTACLPLAISLLLLWLLNALDA